MQGIEAGFSPEALVRGGRPGRTVKMDQGLARRRGLPDTLGAKRCVAVLGRARRRKPNQGINV